MVVSVSCLIVIVGKCSKAEWLYSSIQDWSHLLLLTFLALLLSLSLALCPCPIALYLNYMKLFGTVVTDSKWIFTIVTDFCVSRADNNEIRTRIPVHEHINSRNILFLWIRSSIRARIHPIFSRSYSFVSSSFLYFDFSEMEKSVGNCMSYCIVCTQYNVCALCSAVLVVWYTLSWLSAVTQENTTPTIFAAFCACSVCIHVNSFNYNL